MTNHPNRRPGAEHANRHLLRRTYLAFCIGAGLQPADVERLLLSRGHAMTADRLRALGRQAGPAAVITATELYDLVSAWAQEQATKRGDQK